MTAARYNRHGYVPEGFAAEKQGCTGSNDWNSCSRMRRSGDTSSGKNGWEGEEAARVLGTSEVRIVWRHVLPNLMHLVVVSLVLLFSGLVLSEVMLSWLGIGIAGSWGRMIDQARTELSRDPIIWWNLMAASGALFVLILAANQVADSVRDVLDPRTAAESR